MAYLYIGIMNFGLISQNRRPGVFTEAPDVEKNGQTSDVKLEVPLSGHMTELRRRGPAIREPSL